MQISNHLFPLLRSRDMEKMIVALLPKEELFTYVKVSKAWCYAFDSMAEPFLQAKSLKGSLLNRENTLKIISFAFFSNVLLFRIGLKSYDLLENAAASIKKLGIDQPWIFLALNALEDNNLDRFKIIETTHIRFDNVKLITLFIERLCKQNEIEEATRFYNDHFVEEIHGTEMLSMNLVIEKASIPRSS